MLMGFVQKKTGEIHSKMIIINTWAFKHKAESMSNICYSRSQDFFPTTIFHPPFVPRVIDVFVKILFFGVVYLFQTCWSKATNRNLIEQPTPVRTRER